MFKICSA
jgi:hypothetical protein